MYLERVGSGDAVFDAHLARYRRAADLLPAGIDVLDAGCGLGHGTAALAPGRRVVGVDASPDAVRSAQANAPDARFEVADVCELPFADASFDAIACFEVIEHVREPAALVAELARVLRPGGVAFLSTPHARMERLHARRAGRGPNPHHIAPLTPLRLRRTLRAHFQQVTLFGQLEDRGRLHAALQALDVAGVRLRLSAPRREAVRRAFPDRQAAGGAGARFRFARPLAWSAAMTFAVARKRAP